MKQTISVIPSSSEHYKDILKIYNEGFCQKFKYITKKKEQQLSVAHDFGLINLNSKDKEFVAIAEGEVLGILSLKFAEKHKTAPSPALSYRQLLRNYGFFGLLKGLILDLSFNYSPLKNELYIDSVGVAADARGKGVGSTLLSFVESFAKEKGFSRISLNVMYENQQAKSLYERYGYSVKSRHSLWWLKKSTGFSGAFFMVKEL